VNKVITQDAHQVHSDLAGVTRDQAKGMFFGILFGAGVNKLANMLQIPQSESKELRQKIINGIPNFKSFIDKAKEFVERNGYIPGIDGRKVYPGESFKSVNYIIQSCEAVLMKATLVMVREELKKAGIEFKQLLMYHDEFTLEINKGDEDKASEIIKRCFEEAPKKYGVEIMGAGDVKVGNNYMEVH